MICTSMWSVGSHHCHALLRLSAEMRVDTERRVSGKASGSMLLIRVAATRLQPKALAPELCDPVLRLQLVDLHLQLRRIGDAVARAELLYYLGWQGDVWRGHGRAS